MRGNGGQVMTMECWNWCRPPVLSCPTKLTRWPLDPGGREYEEEEEDEDEFDFDDFSESDCELCSDNCHVEAHERLKHGSTEKIILPCYLPRSIN